MACPECPHCQAIEEYELRDRERIRAEIAAIPVVRPGCRCDCHAYGSGCCGMCRPRNSRQAKRSPRELRDLHDTLTRRATMPDFDQTSTCGTSVSAPQNAGTTHDE